MTWFGTTNYGKHELNRAECFQIAGVRSHTPSVSSKGARMCLVAGAATIKPEAGRTCPRPPLLPHPAASEDRRGYHCQYN